MPKQTTETVYKQSTNVFLQKSWGKQRYMSPTLLSWHTGLLRLGRLVWPWRPVNFVA